MNQNKEKESWIRLIGFILLWYLIVFFMTLAADGLLGILFYSKILTVIFPDSPARETALFYITFLGTWTVIPLFIYLRKQDRPILKALGTKAKGNNWKMALLGLLLGFGMNGFVALIAWFNHDIALHFDSFHPVSFLAIFVCVLIQSSAEELYDRGFLYQKFMKRTGKPAVAIVASSLFFGLMHVFNSNVTVLSIVNIMAVGMFYALSVYYLDSIWFTMAHHTAWNFTQNILLGLPNSGNVVPYSVFKIDAASASSSFAYDVGFGIEGSVLATLMMIAGCIILILWGRKHGGKAINVWETDTAA